MAIISHKKAGFASGTLSAAITTTGQTSLDSAAFANLPAISGGNICKIIMDADGSAGAPEIMYITAHTAAATTVTVSRGDEGTTARTHLNGTDWSHGPTLLDFFPDNTTAGHVLTVVDAQHYPGWAAPADKVYTVRHTFSIPGAIAVPAGTADWIPPFFVELQTGETCSLVLTRHVLQNSGATVTCKIQLNGVDTALAGISVTDTATSTNPSAIALVNDDRINLIVTAVTGTPIGMSFSVFMTHTQ